jgi:ribosomal protein S18 acetylase RimI-like enzyme
LKQHGVASIYDEQMINIRSAIAGDAEAIWRILEPIVRAGDTFALEREMDRAGGLAYWMAEGHEVFVAEMDGAIVGSYYLRANQRGGGAHIANCGYMTDVNLRGKGVAAAMCEHSLVRAKERGFRGMQFNFVVSTNERAVELWKRFGFEVLAKLRGAFEHPEMGFVDALVMWREL